jgi:rhodanese-related sulfurtransferase
VPQDIDRSRLQELQSQGAAVVEVLPREEFENEHLAGAVNLPLQELRPEKVSQLLGADKRRAIVTYCQGND